MKTKSSLLIILMAAFILTSCGSKNTAATLEVSTSALSVSNTSYQGGLVIMGSGNLGSFTIPIPANTGSGNKITLDLPRGKWKFSAVGWDGPSPFSGDSKCGSVTDVDLNQEEQTVNLNISYAGCVGTTFGSANYRSGNAFDNLTISTCGWLYTDIGGSTPVVETDSTMFCDSGANFDAKYKHWAKSVKVEIENEINGVKTPGLSECIPSGTDGTFSLGHSFPERGLPLKITLFREESCSPDFRISTFEFKNGLSNSHSDHDAVFGQQGTVAKLFLPSYDTKRGFSSFLAEKPKILCNGSPCLNVPLTIGGGENRLIQPGREFILIPVPGTNQTCDKITTIGTTGSIAPSPPTTAQIKSSCEMKDGSLTVRMSFTTLVSASLTVNFDGGSPVTLTLKESATAQAHDFAWEMLGYPLSANVIDAIKYSFPTFFENSGKDSGLLTEAREMMGPEGAAGILGPNLVCATATAVNYVTFFDEGLFKTYKIELQNVIPLSQPLVGSFLEEGALLASSSFQKKILLSRVTGPTNIPEMMIHFNCASKVGRLESIHQETGRVEKRLLEWNTQSPSFARVREINYEEEIEPGRTTRIHASYRVAEAPSIDTTVFARAWDLNINWNGSTYNFHTSTKQVNVIDTDGGFRYIEASPLSNSNPSITDTMYLSNLATAIGTPSFTCISKNAFGTATCTTPTGFSNHEYGPDFDENDLTPSNIQSYFTAF